MVQRGSFRRNAEVPPTTKRAQFGPSPQRRFEAKRFYKTQHSYYCGIDLHARSMFTHIDHEGKTVFERDLPVGPDAFLEAVQPFAGDRMAW